MVSVENNSILKKISAVIVMITALVFFSFNVFADTPVQPLQVVTYSDTTTNVRISGTAERLHYNVDSFQVVFMNPPNNYGTSCTPVLVSFRFYNASNTPAYVGQPEFEITATNSTGAVNTIIYGYDQISTDLFVAESSYSTAEVGRIGIGSSNDFAYYTGFVIPPRTSLYFSCIVYVNASAYGQNNTGAQEDVNQVTLSALNLYSNQISFSDDYPYHNEPIDFQPILDAIEDLSDTVSTSTEMQDIIALLTYSGSDPNNTLPNPMYSSAKTYFYDNNGPRMSSYLRYLKPYYLNYDYEYNNTTDQYIGVGTVRYPILVSGAIWNPDFNNTYKGPLYVTLHNVFSSQSLYPVIDKIIGDNIYYVERAGTDLRLYLKAHSYNNSYLMPRTNEYFAIYMYIDRPVGSTVTIPRDEDFNITQFYGDSVTIDNQYYPIDEYNIMRDFYESYNKVNGVDDSSDISDDVADVSDSNHIIEESYYSANASAIEATGLSNYRFSNEQNNGIGQVSSDFMLLWNALGSWNGVYVFTLTLALATFIMRHRGMLPSRSKDDKGGEE